MVPALTETNVEQERKACKWQPAVHHLSPGNLLASLALNGLIIQLSIYLDFPWSQITKHYLCVPMNIL